jgi:hypothetical protein
MKNFQLFPSLLQLINKNWQSLILILVIYFLVISFKFITLLFFPAFIAISLFYLVKEEKSLVTKDFLFFLQNNFFKVFIGQLAVYGIILSFLLAFSLIILAIKTSNFLLIILLPILSSFLLIIIIRLSLTNFFLLEGLPLLQAIRTSYNHPKRLILYKISLSALGILFLLAFLNFPFLAFVVELFTKLLLVKIFFSHDQNF